jgi:hypothetical protein
MVADSRCERCIAILQPFCVGNGLVFSSVLVIGEGTITKGFGLHWCQISPIYRESKSSCPLIFTEFSSIFFHSSSSDENISFVFYRQIEFVDPYLEDRSKDFLSDFVEDVGDRCF